MLIIKNIEKLLLPKYEKFPLMFLKQLITEEKQIDVLVI